VSALWSGLAGSLLALGFVLALAWLALRLLRRFAAPAEHGGGAAELRVLRSIALGPRERLVLVRHGDAELLLGVSAGNIRLLERRSVEPPAP
jgi:flagellar biosynthetic protein FliO